MPLDDLSQKVFCSTAHTVPLPQQLVRETESAHYSRFQPSNPMTNNPRPVAVSLGSFLPSFHCFLAHPGFNQCNLLGPL